MNEPIETFEHAGRMVKLFYDADPESPREWDNAGRMVCFHGRYRLGDKHEFGRDVDAAREHLEQVEREGGVVLPLYLYDHGGITMSTGRFSCPWDSGQVGWVYCDRATMLREWSRPGRPPRCRVTRALRARVERGLRQEVATYDEYLTGQVYGYTVETAAGEHVDSCWGFYGLECCRQEARGAAEFNARKILEAATGAAHDLERVATFL